MKEAVEFIAFAYNLAQAWLELFRTMVSVAQK
jgi:hypothetical protein